MKLAIVLTHPVQYYVPIFQMLSNRGKVHPKVFYTWSQWESENFDKDFKMSIRWDIPLFEGYEYEFVENIATHPGIYSFDGIRNPTLLSRIMDFGADTVLVFGWNYQSHLTLMRKLKGKIPVYFRGDSTLLDEKRGVRTFLRRIWLKWVYRYVDKVFYVGQKNKAYFKAHGLKENQMVYAPHVIDNQRFAGHQNGDWKSRLGLQSGDIVVLFVGKFESKKNPLLLMDAILESQRDDIKLIMVGSGELHTEIENRANSEKVILLPFQNQSKMPEIYGMGDILCLPSQGPGETWGLAVNEAFACGLPAMVSDKVGCYSDLIIEGQTGFVFESGNKGQLIQIIESLDKLRLKEMGEHANELAARKFSYELLISSIENELLN
ncbi:MAG: glycosyltransferase family 4 protein [Cyclobacteriaceae bacterium]|nr:glycosyltransferase family 4 protein [Cyclobacteriaceae bacterium SS2]